MAVAQITLPREQAPPGRKAANIHLWSNFLRALSGLPRGAEIGALDLGGVEDLLAADVVLREQLVARPRLLRSVLAPLVFASDSIKLRNDELRELIFASVRDLHDGAEFSDGDVRDGSPTGGPLAFDDAIELLRKCGARSQSQRLQRAVRSAARLLDPDILLEIEPGYIRKAGGVFVVGRKIRCKAPLEEITKIINPKNWSTLGSFFEYVGPVEGRFRERVGSGWVGFYEERFTVGWSAFRLNSFHPYLKVDFTYDSSCARTDYSLAYEEHGQLECDDGFIEARSIPGRLGWCEYVAEKGMKFRSPTMDLLAPTVTAVFLENFLVAIEDAASEAAGLTS